MKRNIILVHFLIILTVLIGFIVCTHFFIEHKKLKYWNDINKQIDNIFKGKDVIVDYDCEQSKGYITKRSNYKLVKDRTSKKVKDDLFDNKVKEIFVNTGGGFKIYELSRFKGLDFGYYRIEKEIYTSTDIGYKILEKRWEEPFYYNGEQLSSGHYTYTNRPSPSECYKDACKYLINNKLKLKNNYVPGSKARIISGLPVFNEYYSTKNTGTSEYAFDNQGFVYNNTYQVFYKYIDYTYLVRLNKSHVELESSNILFVGFLIAFIAVLINFVRPNYYRNLELFGKKWILKDSTISFFFKYSMFSSHKFTKMEGPLIKSRGIITFSKKNNVINLKNDKSEELFKIIKLDINELVLFDINSKIKLYFSNMNY